MSHHIVVGAGPVGSGIATELAQRGTSVTVVTRSGSGPDLPLVTRVALDASDADRLARACDGADAVYNCVNPPYHRWPTEWPPIHRALMTSAEKTGAVLVMMDNLYPFGPGTPMPMHEGDAINATGEKGAVRASMERDLLAAHADGRIRATMARASDFYGPTVLGSVLGERAMPRILAGKKVSMLGDLDALHSLSYMPDVVRTMITLADDPRAWGAVWHVPNAPAVTQRQAVAALARAAGTSSTATAIPKVALHVAGVFSPMLRGLKETWYQFAEPWVTDSTLTEQTFGLTPTPLDEAAAATVAWWRTRP